MTPTSLITTLLQERGLTDVIELPTELLFDHAYRITFSEPLHGYVALECAVDSLLPGSDPTLQTKLLQWNRLPSVVGEGALATAEDGEAVYYRATVAAWPLDVEQFKALVHNYLNRVESLGAALLSNPLELNFEFEDHARAAFPESTAGMISV